MSSDSDLSSIEDRRNQPESRLQSIWKSIKATRNIDRPHRQKSTSKHSLNKIFAQSAQKIHPEHSRVHQKLINARENTALLMRKLSEAQEQIDILRSDLEKAERSNSQQTAQLRKKLESNINLSKRRHSQAKENDALGQNTDQQKKIESRERQIEKLVLRIKSLELEKKGKDSEIRQLIHQNQIYRQQLNQQAESAGNSMDLKIFKGAELLELDQANKTIQRLITLLKSTQEYKILANFAEQFKNIHFLKKIPKRLKGNRLGHQPPQRKNMCSCMEVKINERLLWTPTICYKTMLEMKMKYDCLNEDCIEQVLFELNKVYLGREQNRVRKLKQGFQIEMSKLKGRLDQNYDQILAKKQINRLKKELRGVKSVAKPKASKIENLRSLGQYQDELKLKEREIKLLQERIKLMEAHAGGYDKALYYEGALWLIQKVLGEVQLNEGNLKEFEIKFRESLTQGMEAEDWLRSYKFFFESLNEINSQFFQHLLSIKSGTMQKIKNGLKKEIL